MKIRKILAMFSIVIGVLLLFPASVYAEDLSVTKTTNLYDYEKCASSSSWSSRTELNSLGYLVKSIGNVKLSDGKFLGYRATYKVSSACTFYITPKGKSSYKTTFGTLRSYVGKSGWKLAVKYTKYDVYYRYWGVLYYTQVGKISVPIYGWHYDHRYYKIATQLTMVGS